MIDLDKVVAPNSFTVYAKAGFFGLTELEAFTRLNVEPYLQAKSRPTLIMDLSAVRMWDIAALLWLAVALHHYRRKEGLKYLLRLPEGTPEMPDHDKDVFDRSADYLRRWRFDRGLRQIDAEVASLLVPSQQMYFDPPEPRRFYPQRTVRLESGVLQSLISRNLAEIRELSDPSFTGSQPISPNNISKCVREFQAERIGDILKTQCGIDKRKADLFSDHLLTEAIHNVREHPNATVGMVAISLMGNTNEIVLSIVDNGDSIPSTIYSRYVQDVTSAGGKLPSLPGDAYDREKLSIEERADAAHHATKPGVTRKTGPEATKAGWGLTYIKNDTVTTFHGKLTIITDWMKMTYQYNPDAEPLVDEWRHSWHGNLLRIAIPLSELSAGQMTQSAMGSMPK